MEETKELVQSIVEGLQEKKGSNIVVVDLTNLSGAISQYMVIGEGKSPSQVSALSDSVWEFARKKTGEKPLSIQMEHRVPHGLEWIMARFLFIYLCRNSASSIIWKSLG